MRLLVLETQEELEAEIQSVEEEDYEAIDKSKQFLFDWKQEKGNHIFKIVISDEELPQNILGLLSITDFPVEFRIHINLFEISNDHKGRNKKMDRIAGCLLAFAAQVAFEKGYAGFISLIPKTSLIELYVKKYGFTQYGRQLAMEGSAAIHLIQKYL